MIIDAIVGVIAFILDTVIGGIMAIIPGPPAELLVAMADGWDLMSNAYVMDHWLPIDLGFIAITAVLAAYGVSAIIGIIRLVVSYFTLGSGAT